MEPGRIGIVVSSSPALARDVERQLSVFGLGASKIVSVPAPGMTQHEVLQMFERHAGTDAVLLLGPIEGADERACTEWIAHMSKPVFGFIDGADAHQPQTARLVACGVHMSHDAASIGELIASLVDCPWLPFD